MRSVTPEAKNSTAIYTIVSNNYLHFARTLLKSVAKHHPEVDLYCVVVDTNKRVAADFKSEFQIIDLTELAIPEFESFSFQYNVLELNTAVKPWAMESLLSRGYDNVIYIDPDIYLYKPMIEVFDALSTNDIVITPHLLSPIHDDKRPTELDIRRAGTYNFGFCAVKKSDNTINFLKWWQSKLFRDCVIDLDRGIFVDQSWIDLVPGLFDSVNVLRHPGYNVAYWNVAQRSVTCNAKGNWQVNDQPLVFFHFSGFNPFKPTAFSKHQNRFTLSTLGPASELARQYSKALIANNAEMFSKLPYGYGYFNDGTVIPDGFRRIYLKNDSLRFKMGHDPFSKSEALLWMVESHDFSSSRPLTWAMYTVWMGREDLKLAFPMSNAGSVENYWQWFLIEGSNYVSDKVLLQHKQYWETNASPSIADENQSNTKIDKATDRVHAIFIAVLGRNPGARGLRLTRKLCHSRLTASFATVLLAANAESRERGQLPVRILNALRYIWKSGLKADVHSNTQSNLETKRSRTALRDYCGIYPADNESTHNGLWCGSSIQVPLPTGPIKILTIRGHCPVSLHRLDTNGVAFVTKIDGTEWNCTTISNENEFIISGEVPSTLENSHLLQIETMSFFVPRTLNLNEDARELSWRLNSITANDLHVVDASRTTPLTPISELKLPGGFNLIGYLAAELGVGEAARTMASAAKTVGIPYSIIDVGYQTENRQSDRRAWVAAVDQVFDIDMLYVNADQTPNTIQYLSSINKAPPAYRIGYWHWEQPKFPHSLMGAFNDIDEVWVPSAFVLEAVASCSPVPVFKVPHAVEFNIDSKWTRESFGIPRDKYAVLVMYDFQSYRYRKNPEAAIAAFRIATTGRHDAVLVIKTINASKYPDDYANLKQDVSGLPHVLFIDDVYTREQIYGLEFCCDCMLSLHRAEGFGFGPAEMMFLGKPVIATGWSGNMEFMTPMNSFPVEYQLRTLANPVGVYAAGVEWAEPDIEHAGSCLRSLLDDSQLAQKIGRAARHTMQTRYSSRAVGQQYKDRLSLIRAMNKLT